MATSTSWVCYFHFKLPSPAWAEGTVLCVCVCVCVCLLPQNCCKFQLSQNLNKLQVINFGNLRQKVVLYKTGKFLQASVA